MIKKVKRNRQFILIVFSACAASCLLFFTSLDNKLFDLFLRFLPPLEENEKVIVLALDDASMDYAGGFPFRREVMADVVVLLKETGVSTIVIDLSYLDESARRFDPDYAADLFVQRFNSETVYLDDVLSVIPQLGRDVDEYLANAIAFSGCSWLPLTMVEHDLSAGKETESFLKDNITSNNVNNNGDTKTPQALSIMPTIQKLLNRADGAGFVNASPDTDGLRRRENLLWKYNGNYYKQLTLAAIQKKLNYSSIDVNNRFISLNINDDNVIRIPRAQDGSVLIRWLNKPFNDYNMMSLVPLIQYITVEPVLAKNIAVMQDSGFFYCWEKELTPWDWYLTAEKQKKKAFSENSPADENWLLAKQEFFKTSEAFLYGNYENIILSDVSGDYEMEQHVRELFEICREQFDLLFSIREKTEKLKDSFCIIGSDATSMTDLSLITFQENYPNVGSYAVLANMLLAKDFVDDSPWFISFIIALCFSFLTGFLINRYDTHISIIIGISGIAVLFGGLALFFIFSRVYPGLAVPLAATTLTFIVILGRKFLTASSEKAFLHNAFSRYLAPEVISEIIVNPDKLNLGGEKREMTAIFTDIQGFSTISEKLDPVHLVKLLNRYLTIMSNIIMENIGTIDKYEGDAIIAFFGAPVFRDNHAVLACRSAVAMKAAEKEFNKTIVEEGLSPIPLFTRIGINTGEMVVGNMGAENKMDYTIMGNAVNLASRLEGVNKHYRTGGILISEYTKAHLGEEFILRRLDRVRVVGINTPVRLYEIISEQLTPGKDLIETRKMIEVWEKAIDLYEAGKFAEALMLFDKCMKSNPDDKVAELYAGWCRMYIENPPVGVWDAVNNITEK